MELSVRRKPNVTTKSSDGRDLFEAEALYADSIFRNTLGDIDASIASVRRAIEIRPDYAPAILTMGSIEYQLGKDDEGRRLFHSLLLLSDQTEDLWEVIDKAGDFLIQRESYADGMRLYEKAIERFPNRARLYQGLACCAGHEELFDNAVSASEKALALDPQSQRLTNDLGWSLFQAGRLEDAERILSRAVVMNPSDELARENLIHCQAERSKR